MIGRVTALATGIDVDDLCEANQLCSALRARIEGESMLCNEHCVDGWGECYATSIV